MNCFWFLNNPSIVFAMWQRLQAKGTNTFVWLLKQQALGNCSLTGWHFWGKHSWGESEKWLRSLRKSFTMSGKTFWFWCNQKNLQGINVTLDAKLNAVRSTATGKALKTRSPDYKSDVFGKFLDVDLKFWIPHAFWAQFFNAIVWI